MSHRSLSLLVCGGCLLPALALGLPEDRDQPIQLQADRAQFDRNTGVSIYEGDVVITQGSMRLVADTVTIYTQDNAFQRLEASGQPATFQYQPAADRDVINGEGRHLHYDAAAARVIITTNAKITQAGDVFTGNRIEYELDKDLVKASSGADGGERVQITIQPRSTSPRKN